MTALLALVAALLVAASFWTPRALARLDMPVVRRRTAPVDPRAVLLCLIGELQSGGNADVAVAATLREFGSAGGSFGQISHVLAPVDSVMHISRETGGSALSSLLAVREAIEQDARLQEHVRQEVAAPKATALLLAALPGFSWWVGSMLGVNPLRWFLSPIGLIVFIVGVGMNTAGVLIIRRMAQRIVVPA